MKTHKQGISDRAMRRVLTSIRTPNKIAMTREFVKVAHPYWVKIHKAWAKRKAELLRRGK